MKRHMIETTAIFDAMADRILLDEVVFLNWDVIQCGTIAIWDAISEEVREG